MIDERDVREMLTRRAGAVPVTPLDAAAPVRRARRRLLVNGAVAVVAAAAIAVTAMAGVSELRGASVPADRPSPSDPVARSAGEVLRFTATSTEASGDLVAVSPATGEERILLAGVADVTNARWSADGRSVAFEMHGALWVLDAAAEPRRVFDGPDLWT